MILATVKANESRRRSHFAQSATFGSVVRCFSFSCTKNHKHWKPENEKCTVKMECCDEFSPIINLVACGRWRWRWKSIASITFWLFASVCLRVESSTRRWRWAGWGTVVCLHLCVIVVAAVGRVAASASWAVPIAVIAFITSESLWWRRHQPTQRWSHHVLTRHEWRWR